MESEATEIRLPRGRERRNYRVLSLYDSRALPEPRRRAAAGDVDGGHSGESAEHIDRTQYALPYPDTTFPSSKDTPCTTRYQIVLLNRQISEQEDGYMCAASSAKLKSDLAGLTKGAEIALVGTTVLR